MHRYLSIGIAAAMLTAFAQPLSAAPKNKGRSGSGKHAQAAKPAKHAKVSPGKSGGQRKFTAPKKGTVVRSKTPAQRSTPSVARRDVARQKVHPQQLRSVSMAQQENIARSQARAQQSRRAAAGAVDRSQFRDTRVESRDRIREYDYRSDDRRYRPPVDVYRDWDRDRVYSWNRHRYHWHGGAWVILNAIPGYGYGYDYPTTYAYSSPSYYSGSLAARVQSRLADEGYDPGPIDGVIGPQTRDAIAGFQADNGLPVTGSIDDPLLRALGL